MSTPDASSRELAQRCEASGYPAAPDGWSAWLPQFGILPFAMALELGTLVLSDPSGNLHVVTADPWKDALSNLLGTRLALPAQWSLAAPAAISACLESHARSVRALDGLGADPRAASEAAIDRSNELSLASIDAETRPVVRLVGSTLHDALQAGASDIHLETGLAGMDIKYRIDGVLVRAGTVEDRRVAEQAIARIKVLSELDIGERRIPQDGRFKVHSNGHSVDLRTSIMPSVHGEDAVLRILDRRSLTGQGGLLTLERLGFSRDQVDCLGDLATQPHGLLLVTGPTGSGKTTTLYGMLSLMHNGRDKVITIEDPVEYLLPGVLQIPVNERKGLSFSRGLRSILRHDPDRILVGEIRDGETAQIAVQSALTGHLVLSSVHANHALDVMARFGTLGVDGASFIRATRAVVAQRLLRTLCENCTVSDRPDGSLLRRSGMSAQTADGVQWRRGQGCSECRGTGYRGRRAVAEILRFTPELRDLLGAGAPQREVRELATRQGLRPLHLTALDLAVRGLTSLEEVCRVTALD